MNLRVVTYNIHKAIGGVDRRYRPNRIVETLAAHQPDIVFMQEVDDGVPRSNHDCQVEYFSDALNLKYKAYQRNVQLKQGCYGNAILSRFRMSDIQDIDLSVPLKKRRRALVTHCQLELGDRHRTLLLANLHLGLAGFERRIQLRKLLDAEIVRRTHHDTPAIIGGDFNDVWETLGKQMHPAGFESVGRRIRTFPAALPVRSLDYLFFRGDLTLDHAFACRSKIAKVASDHLPLVGEFIVANGSY